MDHIKEQLAGLKLKLVNGDRNISIEKIVDHAPCIIVDMTSGLIVFASKRINEVFGYIHNELEGKNISDLMPENLKEKHNVHLSGYSKNPKFRNMGREGMTLTGLKKDGSEFNLKISLEPFFEDGSGFVLATIIEI